MAASTKNVAAHAISDVWRLRSMMIMRRAKILPQHGVVVKRPAGDGRMAFVRSPDNISVELLQKSHPIDPQEPWLSMPNVGNWRSCVSC